MSFRRINQKYLEPGSQILMVLGIVAQIGRAHV